MNYQYHINNKFKIQWQKKILDWYKLNKRDLPWRKSKNKNFYKIWISEVMLQQTTVKTVIPYYESFLKKWPTLSSFYKASLEDILLHWQGLGYYQRARNLFKAKEYLKKNKLTINSISLKKIPGIGEYISCSISAILRDEDCAVVDGNIKRILRRVFNLSENKKQIYSVAQKLTPLSKNGIYCQSLMDFANLVCKAKNPNCSECIFKKICRFDGKIRNKFKTKLKNKKMGVGFFVSKNDNFLVEKSKKKLFQDLYSIPLSDFLITEEKIEIEVLNKIILNWMSSNNINERYKILGFISHIFSHFHLKLFVVEIKLKNKNKFSEYEWMTERIYNSKPKSTLMMKVKKIMLCKS